jgi:adenylate cyclase
MAQRGAVLISDQDGVLLLKHHWPLGKPAVSMTLAQRASRERVAFIWSDEEENPESVIYYNMQSAMYAPLLYRNQVLGVLCIDNQETFDAFTELECDLLRIFANQAALYIKNQMLQQDLQREAAARSNLLRQFPPSVAERMLRQSGRLRLTGEQIAPVTILESDVRGFTTLSATMEPCDVVQMLNEMFCSLTPIIFRYDGVIDKYVGDAILAVFGSPDPDQKQCEKAVLAAIEMQRAMDDLGRRWKSRGITHCDVKIGIGIHSGAVVHGFVGSPERMEYTVIGDTVNRASRLCDGAKPGDVVISKKVYERVFNIIDVVPQIIKTKHPDREPDIEAYAIKGLISQRGFNP